jgi:cell division protein FtsB
MNKPFSEMVEDELYNDRYELLKGISCELKEVLYENAYLRAENKMLKEENERYKKNINDNIKEQNSIIGELLTSFVNKKV